MRGNQLSAILILLIVEILSVNAFYMNYESRQRSSGSVRTLEIVYDKHDQDRFPKKFEINFNGELIKFARIKNDLKNPISAADIYTVQPGTKKTVKFNAKEELTEDFEIYKEVDGDSFATLIQNQDKSEHPFRMIGSIYRKGSNSVYDIMPMADNKPAPRMQTGSKSAYNSKLNGHISYKRADKLVQMMEKQVADYVNSKKHGQTEKLKRMETKQARSNNGVPFELYLELLVVADKTVFEDHKRFAQSTNTDLVFIHMKAYFAHYVNGIAQRYTSSLSTDPDMRITIKLANYLFFTTDAESQWASIGVSGVPTYEGKTVVDGDKVLDAFRDYINSLTLSFNFDHAVGFFNKDMWSGNAGFNERSSVVGLAYLSGVCQNDKFSIVEEEGGFSSIGVTAHEIGHNLGSLHDGTAGQFSAFCPASDNYIMTAGIGNYQTNLLNLIKFSSCSINAFKFYVLTNGNSAVSSSASCLSNVPANNGLNVYVDDLLPGQAFTADDQCKMKYGSTASFCRFTSADMCVSLGCRKSSTATDCSFFPGVGAAEGTTCGSGKMCLSGVCTANTKAPVTTCPFGDDVVVNQQTIYAQLPSTQLSCEETFTYISGSLNQFPLSYCADDRFKAVCCRTCQKYENLTCFDQTPSCPQYAGACNTGALNGIPVNQVCPKTCGTCTKTQLTCSDVTCKNGGVCTNITPTSASALEAFRCTCRTGFTGYTCEIVDQCAQNPCQNQGVCVNYGSNSYVCECKAGCTGQSCENCVGVTTTSTTTLASPCGSNPCVNGGFCQVSGTSYTCLCQSGYTGTNCQTVVSPCSSNPCVNGGFCQVSGTSYTCSCQSGYTGTNCQTIVQTTTTPTTIPCTDRSPINCPVYASQGYCKDFYSIGGIALTTYCAKSCNRCSGTTNVPITTTTATTTNPTTTIPSTCVDQNSNCPFFASRGYCQPSYSIGGVPLTTYCAKSCNNCGTGITTLAPTTTTSTSTTSTTTTTSSTTTTSQTITTTIPSTCVDQNSNCPFFASRGYCQPFYSIAGIPLTRYCAKSCNNCGFITTTTPPTTTTTQSTCTDQNSNCPFFASRGYCQPFYSIAGIPLTRYCAKSCNTC